ncbi:MAG: hypothetical protein QXF82_00865 [Nitrososphaeria archaeon]
MRMMISDQFEINAWPYDRVIIHLGPNGYFVVDFIEFNEINCDQFSIFGEWHWNPEDEYKVLKAKIDVYLSEKAKPTISAEGLLRSTWKCFSITSEKKGE